MLSELWRNLQQLFKPYDLDDYIRDCDPKDIMELEARMRNWERYQRGMDFGNSYWDDIMNKYECKVCGHIHDEEVDGKWDELPQFYLCPECGCHKDEYFLVE